MKTIYKKLLFLLLFLPFSVLAQGTLGGTVLDSKSNQPIPGVNIVIQGSSNGTQTDFDGKFKLPKVNIGDKIVFSFIGYTSQTVSFNNQQSINVSLVEESNELKEVVVQVGYGSVKKKDATGAVALITAKDFNKGAITNTENLINGRVAGVVVTQGGRPGDGAAIRIRGGSSLNASNDPLVVIDGLPVDKGLSSVNPNDIESFSILKDASATAIYGSRGSNGVILIKTKKGTKKDEVQFSFNSYTAVNSLAKKVDVYSADEFRDIIKEFVPTRVALLGTNNTDWQDQIFHDGLTSDNNFSVRGNLLKTVPTRLSVGYTNIGGVLKTSEFDRKTVALSLTPAFFDNHLKVEINANYAYEKNRYADEGSINAAISDNPTLAVYDVNSPFGGYAETYTENAPGAYTTYGASNPLALLEQRHNYGGNNRYYGNAQLEYKFHFFEDLRAVVNGGLDINKREGSDVTDLDARSGMKGLSKLGSSSTSWGNSENKLLDGYLNYAHLFGNVKVDLTTGYSYQNFEDESYYSGNTLDPTSGSDVTTQPTVNLQAYYARLNVDLYNKYLVTLNYRRDGTSRFSELNRWGDFPGVAVAWKVSEEKFLKDSKTINDLKLRVGWGVTGQQDIPAKYDYFKRYNLSGPKSGATYPFGDVYYQLGKPEGYNETLKWEETTTYNVGLDFGFFNNKLSGSLDFYQKITTDLFASVKEGALQNFRTEGPANIGELTSKGVELGLNYKAIENDNSNLSFNFNVAYNNREITSLDRNEYFTGGVGLDVYAQILKEGLSPNSFWVYQQVYNPNGRPIEGAFVDRNGDGAVNSADKYEFHKPDADYTFGFMTNYNYKKWDFSMAWRASVGNYIYDNVSASRAFLSQGLSDNNPNAINNAPVDFDITHFSQKRAEIDYYIHDGSWLKWDNITIGYLFDKPFGLNAKQSSLRLYTGIQNVLIISKYKGMDPEIFQGVDSTIYPRARMAMLGLNFNF
jgi:iron complex outermembrane receptor protein